MHFWRYLRWGDLLALVAILRDGWNERVKIQKSKVQVARIKCSTYHALAESLDCAFGATHEWSPGRANRTASHPLRICAAIFAKKYQITDSAQWLWKSIRRGRSELDYLLLAYVVSGLRRQRKDCAVRCALFCFRLLEIVSRGQ